MQRTGLGAIRLLAEPAVLPFETLALASLHETVQLLLGLLQTFLVEGLFVVHWRCRVGASVTWPHLASLVRQLRRYVAAYHLRGGADPV